MRWLNSLFHSRYCHLCFYVIFLLTAAFLPSNSYAYDVTSLVTPVGHVQIDRLNTSVFFYTNQSCRYASTVATVVNDNANIPCSVERIYFDLTHDISVQPGDVLVLPIHVYAVDDSVSVHSTVSPAYVGSSDNGLDLFNTTFDNFDTNEGVVKFYIKAWTNTTYSGFNLYDSTNTGLISLRNSGNTTGTRFTFDQIEIYRPVGSVDNSGIIGAINSQSNTQNNIQQNTQNMILEQQNTTQAIDDLKAAQEQANQDANDRYDDEKNTIETNINDGVDIVDTSNLGITLFNPFSIFANMSAANCYNINTLSTFIHSPSATYCSWFGSTIRNIFSPMVTLFTGLILFKFGWNWAKKGGI